MTCSETYYPMWSSRGIRGVKCQRPAKWRIGDRLLCGVHARRLKGYGYSVESIG